MPLPASLGDPFATSELADSAQPAPKLMTEANSILVRRLPHAHIAAAAKLNDQFARSAARRVPGCLGIPPEGGTVEPLATLVGPDRPTHMLYFDTDQI